jgi:hypothetical protein
MRRGTFKSGIMITWQWRAWSTAYKEWYVTAPGAKHCVAVLVHMGDPETNKYIAFMQDKGALSQIRFSLEDCLKKLLAERENKGDTDDNGNSGESGSDH